MKRVKRAMKGVALSLAVSLSIGAIPQINVQATEPNGRAITENDFLRAEGKNLVNRSGDVVQLKGTNAGGYLLQEFWMTPTSDTTNVHAEKDIYEYLTDKFGKDKMLELIDIYQAAYWTEEDFDNCADLGINCIRLPFWYRNLVDENGVFYGYNADTAALLADELEAVDGDNSVSGNGSVSGGNSVSGNNMTDGADYNDGEEMEGMLPDEKADALSDDPYAEAFELFDWFIAEAKERGMYVILDFHGAPGSQNGSDHSGVDGRDDKFGASEFFFGDSATTEANQQLYYEIWTVIADRYKDEPTVAGYDLLNEPYCTYRYDVGGKGWNADKLHELLWGIYDKAYDAIRAVDSNHVIIMEATWNPEDLPNPLAYGWENIMYEYHNYLYDDYDNLGGGQIASMQGKLDSIAQADYNVPSYMGEFSYFNNPDAWDEGLKLLSESGMNWTTWTYKTVGSYGMWGLYHHTSDMENKINLETASYEEIAAHWQKVGNSEKNAVLTDVAEKYFKTPSAENILAPVYADLEDGDYYLVNSSTQLVLTGNADNGALAVTDSEMNADAGNQKFTITDNGDGTVSLKVNDKYVSVADDGVLAAVSDTIGDKEKFYIPQASTAQFVLKSYATQKYVSVVGDDRLLVADSFAISDNAAFQIYNMDKILMGSEMSNTYSGWKRYEAEDEKTAVIHGGKLEVDVPDDWTPDYSGGNAAGGMNSDVMLEDVAEDWSNIKYVEFTVEAAEAGAYQMVLRYNGNDNKTILVKVNDGEQEVLSVPQQAGGEWNTMLNQLVTVDLKKGENKICISGTINNEGWMNLDCIDIVNHPVAEVEGSYLRYEAENYYTTANIQTQSFYSGGKGVGDAQVDTKPDEVTENWANVKYVDFTVYAETEDDYKVVLGFSGNDKKGITSLYRIKNEKDEKYGDNQVIELNNAGGAWNQMRKHEFEVHLKKGFNSLQMSGAVITKDDYINIDYIDVRSASIQDAPKAASGWTRYEAESAERKGGQITSQEFYSCGQGVEKVDNADVKVENVAADWSNINYVAFTVDAPEAGDYKLVIAYNGDDDKVAVLKVNDGETRTIEVPNVAEDHLWSKIHEKYVKVTLVKGQNTIYISGAVGGGWMNIDYVDICNNPVTISNQIMETERYEAEYYETKSANSPAVEVQKGLYSGPNEEGVGGMGATYKDYEEGSDILGTAMNYTNFTLYAEEAGNYKVVLLCNGKENDGAKQGAYQLNGQSSVVYDIPEGKAWNDMREAVFEVELQQGFNELLVAGTWDGSWLNFDYIDVTRVRTEDGALEIDSTDSTGMVVLPDKKALEEAVLSTEDKNLMEQGVDITITIRMDETDNPSAEDVSAVNEAKGDRSLGCYLDISISKKLGLAVEDVNETNGEILFSIAIPERLKKQGREFAIIRVHNGSADELANLSQSADEVSFKSDKFSVFALVYKDKKEEPSNPDTPETPEKPDKPQQPDKPSTPGNSGTSNNSGNSSQTASKVEPKYYTVVKGDTMNRIARKFGLTLKELTALNPQIKNPNLIYPGQMVCVGEGSVSDSKEALAEGTYYTVVKGDCMYRIARKHKMTLNELYTLNPVYVNRKYIYAGQKIRIK